MEELGRVKKVLSMMVSMHSYMHYSYHRKVIFVNVSLLISAIVLNSFVFVDKQLFLSLGISETVLQSIIGLSSILVLFFSIILLYVEWDKKSEQHSQAKDQLTSLLGELRELQSYSANYEKEDILEKEKSFLQKYYSINNLLIPIPEKQFNRLKFKHYRKVSLSKFISENPNASYLSLLFRFYKRTGL